MPFAHVYIAAGRDEAKKKLLIEKVTQAITEALGTAPDATSVIVQEIPKTQWGIGGKTLADRAK